MRLSRSLLKAARIALERSLGVSRNERLAIIVDRNCLKIGQAFFREAIELGVEAIVVETAPLKEHGNEPLEIIAMILKNCDAFVVPTTKSITHTKARREASMYGARGVTLPGITEDIFVRTIPINYKKLARRTEKIATLLTSADHAHLRTKAGTDITFDLSHRSGHADTGMVFKPGSFSNLPAGEAYIAPISCNGRVIIDGSVASIGLIKRPILIDIQDGKAVSIHGDRGRLRRILNGLGPAALTIGELGIGTNQHATISGNILEDEKACGTVHIAFGDNQGFGGNVAAPVHIDCLIKGPTLTIKQQIILKDGHITI